MTACKKFPYPSQVQLSLAKLCEYDAARVYVFIASLYDEIDRLTDEQTHTKTSMASIGETLDECSILHKNVLEKLGMVESLARYLESQQHP
jgi:hypothetical protein